MSPDDFAALLRWLYSDDDGDRWLTPAATDLRINVRNIRGMMTGRPPVPATVADVVCALVGAHSQLLGWQDRVTALDALDLSPDVRARIGFHRGNIIAPPDTGGP